MAPGIDLKNYVAEARAQGISDAAIRSALSDAGWDSPSIESALSGKTLLAQIDSPAPIAPSNSSGTGTNAVVPPEIDRWNWGAFLVTGIWGPFNGVFFPFIVMVLGIMLAIAESFFVMFPVGILLTIIAGVFNLAYVIISFVAGAKGSQWAWRKKHWNSVELFKKTQQRWRTVALVIVLIGIVGMVGFSLLLPREVTRPASTGSQSIESSSTAGGTAQYYAPRNEIRKTPDPSIAVSFPTGTSTVTAGSNIAVHWTAQDYPGSQVELEIHNVDWSLDALLNNQNVFVPNTGMATVTIGIGTTPGEYFTRIMCVPFGACPYNDGDLFDITQP